MSKIEIEREKATDNYNRGYKQGLIDGKKIQKDWDIAEFKSDIAKSLLDKEGDTYWKRKYKHCKRVNAVHYKVMKENLQKEITESLKFIEGLRDFTLEAPIISGDIYELRAFINNIASKIKSEIKRRERYFN